MKKTLSSLDLNRPVSAMETPGGVALQHTAEVKQQLLRELVELDKQVAVLERRGGVDFSLMQTYREMIHSRTVLFNQLNR